MVSLTPLIDVVFILLIFFMLASSFLDWRAIDLNTPGARTVGAAMEGALLVEVMPDRLRLSGETLSLEALGERVRQRLAVKPNQPVVVKAAPGVELQRAVKILDGLSAAGAGQVSIIRDR